MDAPFPKRRRLQQLTSVAGAALTLFALAVIAHQKAGNPVFAQTGSPRLAVVISDMNFGVGKDPATGQWHPLEDFRWRDNFVSFLRAVNEAGKGATDLVLNGDTFELWQSLARDCQQKETRLGCTEAEALARLDRSVAAHAPEIADLSTFARAGTNRLVLVPGDHDAALFFPSVAKRVIGALNAPGRVEIAARGYWLSSDGAVYAEHGHQFADDAYRFANWPQPFIRQGGRAYLERTWGEQLVQGIFNEQELRYPIVDNFAEQGMGLDYAIGADPAALPPDRAGPALKFFLFRMNWQQFRQNMDEGDVEPPQWDLPAVRKAGTAFLVESLVPDDRFRPIADRALKEGQLSLDSATLSDEDLTAICDHRAAVRRSRRRLERSLTQMFNSGPVVTECPRLPSTRGSAFDYFWGSRDRRFTRRIEQIRAALQAERRPAESVKVFVFGHTHLPDFGFVTARGADWPVVLNTGAWQRTVTPFQFEQTMKDRNWSVADALRQLQPDDLPGCYGAVWIDPDKPLTRPIWVADTVTNVAKANPRFRSWRDDGKFGDRLDRDALGFGVAEARRGTGCPG